MDEFVIVVDVQADFIRADGALPVPGAQDLVEPLNRWLADLSPDRVAGVLFTYDTHDPEAYAGSAEAALFPPHCLRGTPGWASALDRNGTDPAIPRYRLEKGVFDMWAEPGVVVEPADGRDEPAADRDAFFAALKERGVRRLAVVGVAADYCVRWAVEGLLARGFEVEVPAALTRGIDRDIDAVAAELGSAALTVG